MKKYVLLPSILIVTLLMSACGVSNKVVSVYNNLTGKAEEEIAAPTEKAKIPVIVSSVALGSIKKELVYAGQIMPQESISVISKVPGKVLEIFADVGSKVSLGDLLIKLDEKDIYDQIKQIDASINQSQTSIQTAENAVNSVTGGQYEASILQLETNIENAVKQMENALVSMSSAQIAVDNALLQANNSNFAIENAAFQISNTKLQMDNAQLQMSNAEIANKNALLQVENTELQYNNAKETLDNVKILYEGGVATKNEYDKAELAFNQMKSALEQANLGYEQANNAYEQGKVGLEQLALAHEQAVSAHEQAKVTQEQANLAYEQAKLGLDQAKLGYEQAKSAKEKAEESLELTKGKITEDNLRTAEQSVNQAKAAKQILETQREVALSSLNDMSVYAPMAGIVSAKNAKVGEYVSSQVPAFTIVRVDKVNVEVKVSELLINKITIGDLVKVSIRALDGQEFNGKIVSISPTADQTSTFPVKLELDNAGNLLKPGMFAEIRFVNAESKQTVVLPRNTVLESQNERFVFVEEDGIARRKVVKTGIDNGLSIEVLEGVQVGERVVTKGQDYLADGDPVLIREEVSMGVAQ